MCKKCLRMRLIFGAAGFAIGAIAGGIGMREYMRHKYYIFDKDEFVDACPDEDNEFDGVEEETVNPIHDYGRRIIGIGYDKPDIHELIENYPDRLKVELRDADEEEEEKNDDADEIEEEEYDDTNVNTYVPPYVVTFDEFSNLGHNDGLSKEILHYFVDEGMLYDEYGVIVSEEAVGIEHYEEMDKMEPGASMCIVNENLDLAFEIEIHAGYGDTYFGDDTTPTGGFVKTPKRREMNEEDDE